MKGTRVKWSLGLILACCLLISQADGAQKGKKTTKTSKKNSFPPLVRQQPAVLPPQVTEPPPLPTQHWEAVPDKPEPAPNRILDKMQDGSHLSQISQQTDDIQQSDDIQQIPQQSEDVQQIPQKSEDIQQIPQQSEDIQQIPQQFEDIQQIPQQSEDIQQIPQQNEDIQQIPQQNEDIQQIPQQSEDISQDVDTVPGAQIQQEPQNPRSEKMMDFHQDLPAPKLISNDIRGRSNSGVCTAFGPHHYRTFGGRIFNYNGLCTYVLAQDCTPQSKKTGAFKWGEKFAVSLEHDPQCEDDVQHLPPGGPPVRPCSRPYEAVHLQLNENRYIIHFPTATSGFELFENEQERSLPFFNENVKIYPAQRYLVLRTAKGLIIKLDYEGSAVSVQLPDLYEGKTCGLCGQLGSQSASEEFLTPDGTPMLNANAFGNSWTEIGPDNVCSDVAKEAPICSMNSQKGRKTNDVSSQKCFPIFAAEFATCHDVLDAYPYYESCVIDCCQQKDGQNCECSSLSEYFRECQRVGGKLPRGWRREALCHMDCKNQTVYSECVSPCVPTCLNPEPSCDTQECEDGCECPPNTVSHLGQCIPQNNCPCQLRGREYASGQSVRKDCNTCVCRGGQWTCTNDVCPARCFISGHHHLTTFDGRTYEMPEDCSYALYYSEKYVIEMENVPCRGGSSGSIKNGVKSNIEWSARTVSICSRNLVIVVNNAEKSSYIKLKKFLEVSIDGEEMNTLPVKFQNIFIKQLSSLYLQVELPNGIIVVWNGETGGYVQVPNTFFDKTDGLCGTFNRNQNDDFFTPEGDNELTVAAFARKWRTKENCQTTEEQPTSPCESNPYQLITAEKMCEIIKSSIFAECHDVVDPQPFYQACLEEICVCEGPLESCLCPELEQYALVCSNQGVLVNWRPEVPECGIHCTGGQEYQMCVSSCSYSCAAISVQQNCSDKDCVDGCACPPGYSLDSTGRCVLTSRCPCVYNSKEYPAGYRQQRSGKICECENGRFQCRFDSGVTESPDQLLTCGENQESSECISDCPLTCDNMNHPPKCHTKTCRAGCKCKRGYVLDQTLGKCVRPEQCPCHHGGKSYPDGSAVQMDCNNCLCKGGLWVCTQEQCFGQCTAYGSSHYQSFDGKNYDVQGQCQYVLTRGKSIQGQTFSVIVQNVPCGSSKVICGKEVTFTVGYETVTLSKEGPYPTSSKYLIQEVGLFLYLSSDVGIEILWDKKSRLYVRADPILKGKLQGLCGNFDDDSINDFTLPNGGLPETRAHIFADSWKLHTYCPSSNEVTDICSHKTANRQWASHQCQVLKSDMFAPCHGSVPVQLYYDRCIADTCSCETGGNCDCLCTAIAVYADTCASKGIPITWRSQNLCPIQCEECDQYNPCIPLCPRDTCQSLKTTGKISCKSNPCVEGCDIKPCPFGHMFNYTGNDECVPEAQCEAPNYDCEIEGKIYKDGDWVSEGTLENPCQSCYCRKGRVDCEDQDCPRQKYIEKLPFSPRTEAVPKTQVDYEDEGRSEILPPIKKKKGKDKIRPCTLFGWTEWMNSFQPDEYSDGDYEDIGNHFSKLYQDYDIPCTYPNMSSIECRPVKTTTKKGGSVSEPDDVRCSLPEGLVCENGKGKGAKKCPDYEIRVFCSCENERLIETTTLPPTTTTEEPITEELPIDCLPENHGWSEWVSVTNARADENGDRETVLDTVRATRACPEEHVRNFECRVASTQEAWYDAGQRGITCDMSNGLICLHGKQPKGKKCLDYEVRVYCFCLTPEIATTTTTLAPTTTENPCPPGLRWTPCLFRCDQTCHSYHDKLVMSGTCELDRDPSKCVPGCEYVECNQPGYVQLDERTCVKSAECTCVLPDGSVLAPGTMIQKDCKKCHCVNNKLKCVMVERCGFTTAHALMIVTTCPTPIIPLCDDGYKIAEDSSGPCTEFTCIPECPPGLVWYDCHPRCEKSCINKKRDCSEGCVSGCFCPTGMIRHEDKCVEQNECPDRVCQGFGDPQVVTFDGAMFNFQGKGSFIMANHLESSLIITGHTDYCQGRVACIVGMGVEYQGHKVVMMRNQNVVLDNIPINLERLPVDVAGMMVLGYPGHNYMVVIPELSAQIFYFSSHAAFSIKVPVALFFNRTKGLCGNCNFADEDDDMDVDNDGIPDHKDVLCSYMNEGNYESCVNDNEQQLPVNFDDNPYDCVEFHHPILQECMALVDPEPYRRACLYDVVKGSQSKEAACKALLEFTRQCCELNAPVIDWMESLGCVVQCPEGSKYVQCHDACPQTCTNATTNRDDEGIRYEKMLDLGGGGVKGGSVKGSYNEGVKGGAIKGGKIIEQEFKCHEMKMDGCFCPDGMVFHRGKCMSNSVCDTCDDEGHKPGDSWKDGKCTECHCDYDLKVVCLTPTCPSPPICRSEEMLRVLPNGTDTCCTKYLCEPKPKPTCPPAAVPTCAPGEVAKLKTGKDICPEYLCECDPGLCPMVRWPTELEPGQQVELVNVDCCSKAEVVCHPESCPVPPSCAPGLELKTLPGECCDTYKCKPPEDVCIYTHQLRLVDGAEYPLTETEQVPSIYKPNEKWSDGLCRNCTCEGADGNYSPKCTLEHCPTIEDMPDKKEYALEAIPVPNLCCPVIARLFCKDIFGNLYEVGHEWKSPDNNCLSYRCEISSFGDVQKVERAIVCTECPEYTEYVQPPASLGLCCGWCRPIVCEENGETYPVGSAWNSTVRKCYSAECILDGGSVRTIYTSPKCEAVPEECPPEHIVWDETGCCQKCNITISKCVPALVNETDAIGFLTIHDPRLGVCRNYKTVPGLKECSGTCDSHSKYSLDAGVFQSNCHCCSPQTFEVIEVELECAKGRTIKRKFQQPTSCSCSPCSGESKNDKFTGGTKTKSKNIKTRPQPPGSDFGGQQSEQFGGQEPIGQETISSQDSGQFQQESGNFYFPTESGENGQSNFAFGQSQGMFGGQEPIGQEPAIFPESSDRFQTGQNSDFSRQYQGGTFGPRTSEFGQQPIGQEPSEFGQQPIGQEPSEFGRQHIGQEPSEFGRQHIGQEPSEFGQQQIGQEPSAFGQSPFGSDSHTQHHSSFEQLPNGYRKSHSETSRNSYNHGSESSFSSSSGNGHQTSGDANSDWSKALRDHQKQVEEMMKLQQDYHQAAQAQHAQQLNNFQQQHQG